MIGKFDRRRFNCRRTEAERAWEAWKDETLERERASMREKTEPAKKGAEVSERTGKEDEGSYVLMVVGGPALYVFESLDKAASVCDALTEAARVSGFAAKYDVVQVKRWRE